MKYLPSDPGGITSSNSHPEEAAVEGNGRLRVGLAHVHPTGDTGDVSVSFQAWLAPFSPSLTGTAAHPSWVSAGEFALSFVRYRRVVSGANTAVSAAAVASTITMSRRPRPLHQPARGGRQDRDRVDVDERLERARQRLRLDEDVGEEREREDPHEARVHHRVRRAQQQAERREHPGETEREDDHQRQRRDHAADARAPAGSRGSTPRTMITVPATR